MILIFTIINLFIQICSLQIKLFLIANEKIDSIYINSKIENPNITINFPEIYELIYEGNPGDNITVSIKSSNDKCQFNGGIQLINNEKIYYENWGNWSFDFNVSKGENHPINGHEISIFEIENFDKETNYNFTITIPIEYNCINKSFEGFFNFNTTYELDTSEYVKDIYENNFNSSDSLFIIFTNLSNNSIEIYDNNSENENNTLLENIEYPLLKYKYKFKNYGIINITFIGKSKTDNFQSKNNYYLNFKVCYKSCNNCKDISLDSEKQNCISCLENNYIIEGNENNCYSEDDIKNNKPGYYLDKTEKKFKKCFERCNSCEKLGNKTNNECINCVNNSYKMENDIYNNCYNEKPYENYYLDNSSKIYKKCYDKCKNCSNKQTNEDNCISCIDNNYFIENTTNCISENEKLNYTFFNKSTEKFEYCYSNCTCKMKGNEINHSCIECLYDYYNLEDNNNNCYNKSEILENYFFDKSENIFRKCYRLCKKCNSNGDSKNNICTDCIKYSSFIDNNISYQLNDIYKEDTQNYFFLNKKNNIFLECYNNCKYDNENDTYNNCSICNNNYFFLTGNTFNKCENIFDLKINNINLNNLAPLYNEDFKSYYNLKKVSINNDSNIIYYSPLLINVYDYYNFPLIFLEKCQIELSEKNQKLSELIIALNISQNNIMNYTFHLLGKEKEIYLNNNCVYIKQFPINKTNNTNLLSKILNAKNLNDMISTINSYDIYNSSSQFYINPCISFIIDDKEIDLIERQNMFLNELNLCPENCSLESFNLINKIIRCKCIYNLNNTNIERERISFKKEVEIFGIKIFTCYQIFYSFPNFNTEIYFHYFNFILLILILFFFCYFWFYEIRKIKKVIYHHFLSSKSNPPKENNAIINLGNDSFDNMLELKTFFNNDSEVNTNSNTSTEQNSESIIFRNGNITFQGDIKKEKFKFINEGINIIKKKLFILSLFSSFSKNCIFFPFSLKISNNLFLLSFICFSSTFSIYEESIVNFRNYIISLITIILCCIIQQIIFYLMEKEKILKNSKMKKGNINKFIKTLEITTTIFYCIFILLGLIFWYFNYIFSVIHTKFQFICIINLGIRIIGVLIFDLIINIIIIYFS